MPQIKELSNSQLKDYYEAYLSMQSTDPDNREFLRKIKCIELALHNRDLIDYDLPGAHLKTGLIKKILSIFRKNK
jgi:hypothetical protein